jgi:hypothetical protein
VCSNGSFSLNKGGINPTEKVWFIMDAPKYDNINGELLVYSLYKRGEGNLLVVQKGKVSEVANGNSKFKVCNPLDKTLRDIDAAKLRGSGFRLASQKDYSQLGNTSP